MNKNKKPTIGRGRFIKKIRDSVYAEAWNSSKKKKLNGDFFVIFLFVYKKKNRMSDNTYGSVILHVESWYLFLLL